MTVLCDLHVVEGAVEGRRAVVDVNHGYHEVPDRGVGFGGSGGQGARGVQDFVRLGKEYFFGLFTAILV